MLAAGTVTLAGTAAYMLALDSATKIPPAGAAAFSVTVPVEEVPPTTDAGLSATEESDRTGLMVSDAVWFTPL